MVEKNIDKIFQNVFSDNQRLPDNLKWDKAKARKKFKTNKLKTMLFKLSVPVAATILIVFSLLFYLSETNRSSVYTNFIVEDEFEEFQKRQKLYEIEMKMSGKEIYNNYCLNCNELLPLDKKKTKYKESIKFYFEFYQ